MYSTSARTPATSLGYLHNPIPILTAPSPYMPAGYSHMANNGSMQSQGGFDSRAEQAFNQGSSHQQAGPGAYSNGAYGNTGGYGNDGSDPFSFLSANMGQLGLSDGDNRRNGQAGAKSPQ